MGSIEYNKLILSKVSFNPELFKRELEKSISALSGQELSLLKAWCIKEYGRTYPEIIIDKFGLY